VENETAALASFSTSFISLVFFSGTHPAGYHTPQELFSDAAASSGLEKEEGAQVLVGMGLHAGTSFSYPVA